MASGSARGVEQQPAAFVAVAVAGRVGRSSTTAATVEHPAQPLPVAGAVPGGSASTAARRPSSATNPWYSKAISRSTPTGMCSCAAPARAARGLCRHRPLSANHGNASWRRADRLPRRSRGCWPTTPAPERGQVPLVPPDLRQASSFPRTVRPARPSLQQPPGPDPRDQADAELDAAGPVDPERNGFSRHHERRWSATRSAYARRRSPTRPWPAPSGGVGGRAPRPA